MNDLVKRWSLGLYAPGNYHCLCSECRQEFIGDKRAIQCLPCAAEKAAARIEKLEAALRMIRDHEPERLAWSVGLARAAFEERT